MSIKHVEQRWSLYQLLTKIMRASLNEEIELNSEQSPVPNFPTKKSDWSEWAMGVAFLIQLQETEDLTDEALKTIISAINANHQIAAAAKVKSPDTTTIDSLIEGLNDLNAVIKADERFHAALAIGIAVADEVERRRGLA